MIAAMRREAADRAKREEAARVVERWNKAIAAGRDMWGRRRDAEGGRAIGGQSMNGAVPALLSQIGAGQRRDQESRSLILARMRVTLDGLADSTGLWVRRSLRTPARLSPAQKSGLSAVGTSEYVPGCHWGFSAQTSSSHSSKARRNVTVADQGAVKAPSSSTVSWICSPLPL
jgi:hypothetical protein